MYTIKKWILSDIIVKSAPGLFFCVFIDRLYRARTKWELEKRHTHTLTHTQTRTHRTCCIWKIALFDIKQRRQFQQLSMLTDRKWKELHRLSTHLNLYIIHMYVCGTYILYWCVCIYICTCIWAKVLFVGVYLMRIFIPSSGTEPQRTVLYLPIHTHTHRYIICIFRQSEVEASSEFAITSDKL